MIALVKLLSQPHRLGKRLSTRLALDAGRVPLDTIESLFNGLAELKLMIHSKS